MYTGLEICNKIQSMYPGVGSCGAEISVSFNEKNKAWLVHLEKDNHTLDHYLALSDAEDCLAGKQCVALGLEISQLLHNVASEQF